MRRRDESRKRQTRKPDPAARRPRTGWAEASQKIADAGDDALVWPEFGNDEDGDLRW
jgi:hypothetical protein